MTYEEAKEIIKTAIAEVEWSYPLVYDVAFEKAIVAIEKQIPKKVIGPSHNCCPVCYSTITKKGFYCPMCGQKLDWSDLK